MASNGIVARGHGNPGSFMAQAPFFRVCINERADHALAIAHTYRRHQWARGHEKCPKTIGQYEYISERFFKINLVPAKQFGSSFFGYIYIYISKIAQTRRRWTLNPAAHSELPSNHIRNNKAIRRPTLHYLWTEFLKVYSRNGVIIIM